MPYSEIICNFSILETHQRIYMNTKCICISTMELLGKDIAEMCEVHKVDHVHLFGDEIYANKLIIPAIEEYSAKNYLFNHIKISVN